MQIDKNRLKLPSNPRNKVITNRWFYPCAKWPHDIRGKEPTNITCNHFGTKQIQPWPKNTARQKLDQRSNSISRPDFRSQELSPKGSSQFNSQGNLRFPCELNAQVTGKAFGLTSYLCCAHFMMHRIYSIRCSWNEHVNVWWGLWPHHTLTVSFWVWVWPCLPTSPSPSGRGGGNRPHSHEKRNGGLG